MKTIVTLQQTRNGIYNSIPSKEELVHFIKLSETAKDMYLQDNYYVNGHGEGASNLLLLAQATKEAVNNIIIEIVKI